MTERMSGGPCDFGYWVVEEPPATLERPGGWRHGRRRAARMDSVAPAGDWLLTPIEYEDHSRCGEPDECSGCGRTGLQLGDGEYAEFAVGAKEMRRYRTPRLCDACSPRLWLRRHLNDRARYRPFGAL